MAISIRRSAKEAAAIPYKPIDVISNATAAKAENTVAPNRQGLNSGATMSRASTPPAAGSSGFALCINERACATNVRASPLARTNRAPAGASGTCASGT